MSQALFLPANQVFVANVGVSGDTIRWTYTVPNGRRASIQYMKVRVFETVATGFGAAYIRINFLGSSATINNMLVAQSQNAIGDRFVTMACDIDMIGGDVLQCTNANAGAVALLMECAAVIREYQ